MRHLLLLMTLLTPFIATSDDGIVMTKEAELMSVTDINSDADGNLTCNFRQQKIILPQTAYIYVKIAKPAEITEADTLLNKHDFTTAEVKFNELKLKYCYSGWRVYCIWKQAEAMRAINKTEAAAELLIPLMNEKVADIEQDAWKYAAALKSLAEIYISMQIYDKAAHVLNTIIIAGDSEAVVYAATELGNIAVLQHDNSRAKTMYIQAVMLGEGKTPRRLEALSKLIDILKKEQDKNSAYYENMLQKLK